MKLHRTSSLGARLSRWLAVQSMVGLGLVCGTLYFAMDWTLGKRQHETLVQKELAVRDQVTQNLAKPNPEELTHLLDAMLAGHADLGIRLEDGQKNLIFEHVLPPGANTTGAHAHEVDMAIEGMPGPLRMSLQLDTGADAALLRRVAWMLFLAAVGGSAMVSTGAFFLVRWNLLPLHQLVEQTQRVTADTLERRLDGSAQPAELQPLIAQINALLDRLAAAYTQMEAFNADVAHELNTPLTVLISSSELALRKARSLAELQDVLGSNLEELDRLARIVADMLFLSRAHRGIGARREPVASLAQMASDVVEFHEAAMQEANVSLRLKGDASGSVDAGLLQRALSNLLSNATRHARSGSSVELRIHRRSPEAVEITVENEGETIDPAHLPRLFDRFFRVDPARTHADRNHGLGLAIVGAIAHMHQGGTLAESRAGRTRIGLWLATADS